MECDWAPDWLEANKWYGWLCDIAKHPDTGRFRATALCYWALEGGRRIEIKGRWCPTRIGAWRSLDAALRWAQKQLGG